MRTVIALLLLANSLIAAPRVLSPERPVGDDPKSSLNTLAGPDIGIASNGETTVAVWTDHRLGDTTAVVATRLSDAGDALDPKGIILGTGGNAQVQRVIWDGHRFLVAWSSEGAIWISTLAPYSARLVAGSPQPIGFDLLARPDGGLMMLSAADRQLTLTMLDSQLYVTKRLVLGNDVTNCRFVGSGNTILATWVQAHLGTSTLIAQRLDPDGAPTGLAAQIATIDNEFVTMATAPSLFAYQASGSVHVFDVQPNGALNPLRTFEASNVASIVRTIDGGFIAIEQARPPAPTTFRNFDAGGNLRDQFSLGSFDYPSLTTAQNGAVLAVAVGYGGSTPVSYLYGARKTKSLSTIEPVQTGARVATDGTNALLVWREYPYRLYAQLVSMTGVPLHDRLDLGSPQSDPAVTFDGTSYVVVYATPTQEVVAQRIAHDGSHAEESFVLGSSTRHITNVVAAGNVVAWIDDAHFSQGRTVWTTLDGRVPMDGSTSRQIALASDGSSVLLASATQQNTVTVSTPGGFEIPIPTQYSRDRIGIAGNGEQWLLVYGDGGQLRAQFLAYDGTWTGEPLQLGQINEGVTPHVIWDGDEFLVTTDGYEIVQVDPRGAGNDVFRSVLWSPPANNDAVYANGTVLFAYPRLAETNSSRVFTRALTRTRVRAVGR